MAHIPEWCGVCKSRHPHHFCETENHYTCIACHGFCVNFKHNWRKLDEEAKGGKDQEG